MLRDVNLLTIQSEKNELSFVLFFDIWIHGVVETQKKEEIGEKALIQG